MINILLVDDHKMLREGIKQLLEFDSDIKVTAQASTGEECLACLEKEEFDEVILDLNLPDISGIDLLKTINVSYPLLPVLILTVHNETDYVVDALDYGAKGYVLKESGSEILLDAIHIIKRGEKYIEPRLIPALNARLLKRDTERHEVRDITRREKEILKHLASGMSNKDIADEFSISERTIKNQLTVLFKKIGVSDRTQAAVYAIKHDIVKEA